MTTIIREPQTLNGELAADDVEEPEGFGIGPYDITSSPNDFNVATIFNFMESGTVIIPEFQRHYVWDLKHASKLIESLLIGLPIPQIFLYEEAPNKFLVIDGQQRLSGLIQSKAISRQYYTYFKWETANANAFFALFGSDFREFMQAEVKQNPELDSAVRAFLDLGRDRNNVVHVDFATNAAAKTADEVYDAYQTALQFVDALPVKYREFASRQER